MQGPNGRAGIIHDTGPTATASRTSRGAAALRLGPGHHVHTSPSEHVICIITGDGPGEFGRDNIDMVQIRVPIIRDLDLRDLDHRVIEARAPRSSGSHMAHIAGKDADGSLSHGFTSHRCARVTARICSNCNLMD